MTDANPVTIELPANFLRGPKPKITKKTIDFKAEGLREYEGCYAVVLDGVLSEEECNTLVAAVEATTNGKWERAMINIGYGLQKMREDVRKCGRIIVDDRDMMRRLWDRVEGEVPEILHLDNWPDVTGMHAALAGELWGMTRLNERARFLKYVGGEYFKPHGDGQYMTEDGFERSYFTLHLYLNDGTAKDGEEALEGGATIFHSHCDKDLKVEPKAGRVLLFQQHHLIHSGEDVVKGTKLTMRTDVMYAREPNNKVKELKNPLSRRAVEECKKLLRNPFY